MQACRLSRSIALVSALSLGCAPEPTLGDADLGVDASTDAPTVRLDAPDARPSFDAPPESWTLERARAGYCEPLAAAECRAWTECACLIGALPCRVEALVDRCVVELEAGLVDGRTLDGRVLRLLLSQRSAGWDACLPPEGEGLPTAFVQPVGIGARCAPSVSPDGDGCAAGDGVCLGGICGSRGRLGSPCVAGACGVGLRCRSGCEPLGGDGAPCEDSLDLAVCEPGLVCAVGHCTRLRSAGETCADETECVPCTTCAGGRCVAVTRCDPSAAEGCGFGADCARGFCQPFGDLGDACGAVDCLPPLVCLSSTLRCASPPAVGEPCASVTSAGASCGRDAWCDGTTCRAFPALGETCTSRCAVDLGCVGGVCVSLAENGAACDPSGIGAPRCRDGYCPVERVCRAYVEPGGACPYGNECGAGFCVEGTCHRWPALGEPCLVGFCDAGLACGVAGECVAGAGAECDLRRSSWLRCGFEQECVPTFECGR